MATAVPARATTGHRALVVVIVGRANYVICGETELGVLRTTLRVSVTWVLVASGGSV